MTFLKVKILIVFVVLSFVAGSYYFFSNSEKNNEAKPVEKNSPKIENVMEKAEKKVENEVPNDLIQCSEDIFSNMNACLDLPDNTVCGYDKTSYEDGSIKTHGLEYRTPCHYCNFFGEDLEKDMMGTKVEALGYSIGSCK